MIAVSGPFYVASLKLRSLRPAVPPSPGAYEARPLKKVVDATAWLW